MKNFRVRDIDINFEQSASFIMFNVNEIDVRLIHCSNPVIG